MMDADLIRGRSIRNGRSRRKMLLCFLLLVCLAETGCRTAEPTAAKDSNAVRTDNPPAVAGSRSPLQLTAIGEVVGYNTVIVKSRVDGPVVQIAFQEGQTVKQGDLLAVIDPDTYRVALNEAQASRDKDSAELNQDKATFARAKALYAEGIIAKQEFEKQEAAFHQMEGTVNADQAAVDRASLELSYTRILAPLEGRVGFKTVDAGNVVHPNDPGGIVTITQIRPIAVVFSVPPDRLNQILKSKQQHSVSVEAFSVDGKSSLGNGEVLTADTDIDSATGAAKIKALFPNTEQLLWPNEFVQIRLQLDAGITRGGSENRGHSQ
jgi:multidrug efflux system membrane fusion protein